MKTATLWCVGSVISFALSVLCFLGTVVFGLMTLSNPHSDITRLYTSILTVLGAAGTVGLWLLGRVLDGEPTEARPEDDTWRRSYD